MLLNLVQFATVVRLARGAMGTSRKVPIREVTRKREKMVTQVCKEGIVELEDKLQMIDKEELGVGILPHLPFVMM